MVEHLPSPAAFDNVFHALAHPIRRAMLHNLVLAEYSLTHLALISGGHHMSFAAASKHVRVLEEAGLVTRRIDGRAHYCRIAPGPLKDAHEWLGFFERFWNRKSDGAETLLMPEAGTPRPRRRKRK